MSVHVAEKTKNSVYYRCVKCRQNHIINWRKLQRLKAIKYLGGKCIKCGYNKCTAALTFHHRKPEDKKFSINNSTTTAKWEILLEEIKKCDLLCFNCHMELHYGEVPESG